MKYQSTLTFKKFSYHTCQRTKRAMAVLTYTSHHKRLGYICFTIRLGHFKFNAGITELENAVLRFANMNENRFGSDIISTDYK